MEVNLIMCEIKDQIKHLKIKGTFLDRTKSITPDMALKFKVLHNQGKSYSYIGKLFGYSANTIKYHCLGAKERLEFQKKKAEMKKKWYYSKDKTIIKQMSNNWKESTTKYKTELLTTKLNNS